MRKTKTKRGRIYGVGVNDADYAVCPRVNGRIRWCPYYAVWREMFKRCYSEKYQEKFPTYRGCFVVEEWHSFMAFRSWMVEKEWEGNQLDKDLLVKGNKVYSPDTCLFVSPQVNSFLLESASIRGEYPIGVCLQSRTGKYVGLCRNLGKGQTYLGLFESPEEAHAAYLEYKKMLSVELASLQTNKLIAECLINRYS